MSKESAQTLSRQRVRPVEQFHVWTIRITVIPTPLQASLSTFHPHSGAQAHFTASLLPPPLPNNNGIRTAPVRCRLCRWLSCWFALYRIGAAVCVICTDGPSALRVRVWPCISCSTGPRLRPAQAQGEASIGGSNARCHTVTASTSKNGGFVGARWKCSPTSHRRFLPRFTPSLSER